MYHGRSTGTHYEAGTFTIADRNGDIAVVKCNSRTVAVIRPCEGERFVATANNFNTKRLKLYCNHEIDDCRSDDRNHTAKTSMQLNQAGYSAPFAQDVLSG